MTVRVRVRVSARLAHERRQLVVVAHQHEAAREAERAEAHLVRVRDEVGVRGVRVRVR